MFVYRITLVKYSDQLIASGRAARWNSNDVNLIYTASSQSLACLENVVHRSYLGLNHEFRLMKIEVPDNLEMEEIKLAELKKNWTKFESNPYTQQIGDSWIKSMNTALLKVPSSIIFQENNYLINPKHLDFDRIKLISVEPFVFDQRIKS